MQLTQRICGAVYNNFGKTLKTLMLATMSRCLHMGHLFNAIRACHHASRGGARDKLEIYEDSKSLERRLVEAISTISST